MGNLRDYIAVALLVAAASDHAVGSATTFHVSPFGSNTPPYSTYSTAAHRVADAANLATATINWGGGIETEAARMVSLAGGNEVYGIEFNFPPGGTFSDRVMALHAFAGQPISLHDCRLKFVRAYFDGNTRFEVFQNEFIYTSHNALFVGGRHCLIHDNLFSVSGANGSGKGIWAWDGDTIIVEKNRLLADVDQYSNPFSIEIEECDTAVIRNNLIQNSKAAIIWSETDGLIENNTIIHCDPDWFASVEIFQNPTDQLVVRNNIFVDMERPIAWGPHNTGGTDTAGVTTLVHNVFWPPRDTLYKLYPPGVSPGRFPVVESLNVFAYPMFVDESTYCPQAGSPLIDTGDPVLADVDLSRSDIGWHGGPEGFLCSAPQLPPLPPESLWVNGNGNLVAIAWTSRPESDLEEYRLYRGTSSGFWVQGMLPHKIITAPDTMTADTLLSAGESYYYVVTGRDTAGFESGPSVERGFIISGIFDDPGSGNVPRSPRILRVYPNPFNISTTLEIYIPDVSSIPASVRIELYDASGRLAAVPYQAILSSGYTSAEITAVDSKGQSLASGVYFARLRVGSDIIGKPQKLVLLK